ncbi:molybdenum cofactor guanylyltransferase [Aureimonas sp. AU4]|uniref:molybdenum cofactor guanylyltransferase n=1 Tax=Aureimonas sp. AU4 TaxID=1638163 RepID=UPI0007867ED1|nr:NTP transferase domain-containing protein [Aureimonas sp. AU4]
MSVVGVVLAGGRGSRLGADVPKPFVHLAGRPLIEHVIERLAPQVDDLLVSVAPSPFADALGRVVVPDEGELFQGPGVGIVSAWHHLAARAEDAPFQLAPAAGDTPFLPLDLVERLSSSVPPDGVAIPTYRGRWIPTFAVWSSEAASRIADAHGRSIRALATAAPHAVVDFPPVADAPDGDPFFNINTPEDLDRARLHVTRGEIG